jgi:hypothetical protein
MFEALDHIRSTILVTSRVGINPFDRHALDTQLLARGRYAKEFHLSDEFDRKREQLRRRNFAHIKNHEELLEDKTSYGETFFVPPPRVHEHGAEVALFLGLLAAASAAA